MSTSTFGTVTTNTLYQAAGKAISIMLSLVTTALLTRHLGEAGYGQYTLITTVIILFGSITDWGSGFIATRMASRTKEQKNKRTKEQEIAKTESQFPPSQIYGNLLILRILATTIGAFIMVTLGFLKVINLPLPLITLGSLVLFAIALRNAMQVVFQVNLKLQYGAIVEVLTSIIFLGLTFFAVSQSSISPQSVIMYLLIASSFAGLTSLFFGYRLTEIRYQLSTKLLGHLIKEALPMGTLLVVFSIYNRLDSFLLQHFQGDTAVGLYGLAYKVHDNLVMGAAFFMNAMYPLIAKSGQGTAQTKKFFATGFHLLLLVGTLVAIIFALFSQPIVLLLGGPKFIISASLIRILMFATLISYINHLTGYTLAALGLQRVSLAAAIGALIVNIILNILFIPLYSYYASAFITIITEAIVLVFTLSYLIRRQHLTPSLARLHQTIYSLLFKRRDLF